MQVHEAHQFLGTVRGMDRRAIHQRYRHLSKVYHPDAGGDTETFSRLKEAYDAVAREQSGRHAGAHRASHEDPHTKKKDNKSSQAYKQMCVLAALNTHAGQEIYNRLQDLENGRKVYNSNRPYIAGAIGTASVITIGGALTYLFDQQAGIIGMGVGGLGILGACTYTLSQPGARTIEKRIQRGMQRLYEMGDEILKHEQKQSQEQGPHRKGP